MKRMAFGFFGISYFESYGHWSSKLKDIDFRTRIDNYKEAFFDHFSKKYRIDIFISTYRHQFINQLLNIYNPKDYILSDFSPRPVNRPNRSDYKAKNMMVIKLLDLITNYSNQNNIVYDQVCLSRFDLKWIRKFEDCRNPIDYNKVNNVSILEKPNLFDDNWFLFPFTFINSIKSIFEKKVGWNTHYFLEDFRKEIGEPNFLHSDYKTVGGITTYKIENKWVKK